MPPLVQRIENLLLVSSTPPFRNLSMAFPLGLALSIWGHTTQRKNGSETYHDLFILLVLFQELYKKTQVFIRGVNHHQAVCQRRRYSLFLGCCIQCWYWCRHCTVCSSNLERWLCCGYSYMTLDWISQLRYRLPWAIPVTWRLLLSILTQFFSHFGKFWQTTGERYFETHI